MGPGADRGMANGDTAGEATDEEDGDPEEDSVAGEMRCGSARNPAMIGSGSGVAGGSGGDGVAAAGEK
jgi:hypothetical protein